MQPIENFETIQSLFVGIYYALGVWAILFLLAEIFAGQILRRRRGEPKPVRTVVPFQPKIVDGQNWVAALARE